MRTSLLAIFLSGVLRAGAAQQATIIDTGSTNTPGMTVSMSGKRRALVEHARGGAKSYINLTGSLKSRLLKDLEAVGPVDQLKVAHCMKSASFGSRIFVEYKGLRSPDISCPGQTDAGVEALRTDVDEIMAEARKK